MSSEKLILLCSAIYMTAEKCEMIYYSSPAEILSVIRTKYSKDDLLTEERNLFTDLNFKCYGYPTANNFIERFSLMFKLTHQEA